MMMNAMQTLARQAPGALARHAPRAAGAALSTMASRGLLSASRKARTERAPPNPALRAATRDITVGRDGRNWNSVLLMVPQAEEWQIERFGKFSHTATPGLSFAIPIIDEIAYKRSLKETTIAIHPQTAITKDNVHVHLDGAVYTRVVDAYKASYGIEDPEGAITTLAQSAMRKEVGNLELDQLFLEREKLNIGIAQALDEASQPWGIRVFRYEIADIHVDRGTREAMEKQSNAERLRRAEVLESEGYRQKLINQSEGEHLCGNQPVCRVRRGRPGSVERRGTGIATPSSRRRVDGVEDDAMIQHERAVKF